jgi:DNA-binding transcriptional LysR family regulator
MSAPGVPTFDQLHIFLAVVDAGSFTAAARTLNRAVSAISYGIANLEAQLGLILFDREGARRPVLTEAGQAMLAEARAIAGGIDGMRAKAQGLLQGLEAEVNLVVDVMFPPERLGRVLRQFARIYPTVTLRLSVETLGQTNALVLDGRAVIGVAGPLAAEAEALEKRAAGEVTMVPVAAPDHPLAQMARPAPGAARDFVQLVLSDRSPLTQGRDFSVLSARSWRLSDLSAKHALLRQGIGWGSMPLPMIESDLAAGTLVRLSLPDFPGGQYSFAIIWRRDAPPGPAGRWLVDQFAEE